MAVTLTTGDRQVRAGTFGAVENLTQSTATTETAISVHVPVTTIAASTATGFNIAKFLLGTAGIEGQEKWIQMLGTGEAKVRVAEIATGRITAPGFWTQTLITSTTTATDTIGVLFTTATGAFVLTTRENFVFLKRINERWVPVGGFATWATAT